MYMLQLHALCSSACGGVWLYSGDGITGFPCGVIAALY